MLVIDPEVCIDCGVCQPECPADAILPDNDPQAEQWLELNRNYARQWPVIEKAKPAPGDADEFKGKPGKFSLFFSEEPALR
jgi:ferredoxin